LSIQHLIATGEHNISYYLSYPLALDRFCLHLGEVMIICNDICDDGFLIREFNIAI
jgi:hypothetical protein